MAGHTIGSDHRAGIAGIAPLGRGDRRAVQAARRPAPKATNSSRELLTRERWRERRKSGRDRPLQEPP
jgi:hypothetical protein